MLDHSFFYHLLFYCIQTPVAGCDKSITTTIILHVPVLCHNILPRSNENCSFKETEHTSYSRTFQESSSQIEFRRCNLGLELQDGRIRLVKQLWIVRCVNAVQR